MCQIKVPPTSSPNQLPHQDMLHTHTHTYTQTSTTLICQPQCYCDLQSQIVSFFGFVRACEFCAPSYFPRFGLKVNITKPNLNSPSGLIFSSALCTKCSLTLCLFVVVLDQGQRKAGCNYFKQNILLLHIRLGKLINIYNQWLQAIKAYCLW